MPRILALSWSDEIGARYGHILSALSDGDAKLALQRAAKHEGKKAHTQVKRALVRNSGLGKYGFAKDRVILKNPTLDNPSIEIVATGRETNLIFFRARQVKQGVVSFPWGRRRLLPHRFFIQNNRVLGRMGRARYPIRPAFGPNIAREMTRDYILLPWQFAVGGLPDRVGHELKQMLDGTIKPKYSHGKRLW